MQRVYVTAGLAIISQITVAGLIVPGSALVELVLKNIQNVLYFFPKMCGWRCLYLILPNV